MLGADEKLGQCPTNIRSKRRPNRPVRVTLLQLLGIRTRATGSLIGLMSRCPRLLPGHTQFGTLLGSSTWGWPAGVCEANEVDSPDEPVKAKDLWTRLNSHASGRRSGDQFCVYVCDRFVVPALSVAQQAQIAEGRLALDKLTSRTDS